MEQPNDLVTPREIFEAFPELPRHGFYRMVARGKVRRYEQPAVPWRDRKLYLYSLSEVAEALGVNN